MPGCSRRKVVQKKLHHSPPNTPETRNIGSFLKQTPRARPGPKTGPHAPRPKEIFSVCLKQIAAIKLLMLWQPNTHEHKRYHRFASLLCIASFRASC